MEKRSAPTVGKDGKVKEQSGLCHCGGCHQAFRSLGAFDKHRVTDAGRRRCRTDAEMLAVGMVRTEKGQWRANDKKYPTGVHDHSAPRIDSEAAGNAKVARNAEKWLLGHNWE